MAKLLGAAVPSEVRSDPRAGAALIWLADVGESIRAISSALVQLGNANPAG